MSELAPHRIVRLENDAVVVLDQRRLPAEEVELRCLTSAEVAEAIRTVVVAPTSTIDPRAVDGHSIPIEERDPGEVTARFPARNPAFDVTPAELITAIVTEHGVHCAPYSETLARETDVAR